MTENKSDIPRQNEIPRYTKIGIRVTVVIILILTFFLVKNCAKSLYFGTVTKQDEIERYYEQGYNEGLKKGNGLEPEKDFEHENPILNKEYQKGFRKGWDKAKQSSAERN